MEYKRDIVNLDGLVPSRSLTFLYRNKIGRFLLKIMISRTVSVIAGKFLDSRLSKPLIKKFVRTNNIDLSQFESESFKSFNDCFIRKIHLSNRPMSENKNDFLAPCDSKMTAYKISENSRYKIKNSFYSISKLLGNDENAKLFSNGMALVFRLCVDDYHRYAFCCDGEIENNYFIKSKLHTVQPIALEKDDFFKENCREITMVKSDEFGTIAYIEIGAMMVGKIVNHKKSGYSVRGEEKGYFKYGGSTVVVLVQNGKIKIDDEIINNTNNNSETIVKYRETIGELIRNDF